MSWVLIISIILAPSLGTSNYPAAVAIHSIPGYTSAESCQTAAIAFTKHHSDREFVQVKTVCSQQR